MSYDTEKKVITKEEYYQLIGLLTLGKEYQHRIDDIIKSMSIITGEDCYGHGHGADAVYCGYTPEDLLDRLDIKVRE